MVVMCTGTSTVLCSSDESPLTHIHSSTNTFFKVSLVGIQFTYNRPSETFFLFRGALKCWCGTIATMFSQAPRRDSQDLCCFSLVEDNCVLSVPLSTSDVHYSCWQSGKNCKVVSAGAFTLLCHAFRFSLKGCFSPCFFLSSGPRGSLLDVSLLVGLPLRPSDPVCCCHQDSSTRGRLAFAQEAVRDSPSLSPRLVLHVMTCAR